MPGNTKDVSLLSKSVLKSSELSASKNIKNVLNETRILTENADDSIKLCLACTLNLNKSEEKNLSIMHLILSSVLHCCKMNVVY